MIEHSSYKDQLHTYLSGNLSEEDKRNFERWLDASDENKRELEVAKKIWANSGLKLALKKDDTESHWQEFQAKIKQQHLTLSLSKTWFKVAASIALLAGVAYTLFYITSPTEFTQRATSSVTSLYLPDSTRVWLNVGSTLTYNEDFGKENRNVVLEGEGYFNVKRDEAHPFTVNTADALVHVVGTSFNIKEDSTGEIVLNVVEGKVKFASSEKEPGILVERGEEARYHAGVAPGKVKQNTMNFAAWRKFNNAAYVEEKSNPKKFIRVKFSWHKNLINQSTIKGTLFNSASLAGYENIVLKVTHVNAKRKSQIKYVKLSDVLTAGNTVNFDKRLADILTDTQHINVEIEKVEVIPWCFLYSVYDKSW